MPAEACLKMTSGFITEDQLAGFRRDGYLRVPCLFDSEEMGLLDRIARSDAEKLEKLVTRKDGEGGEAKIWLAAETDREDIYNAFCHGRRIVETIERLLGDEVYLYHYKMTVKEPRVGGAWAWHQDYGYWYHNGCLYPDMASCYVAVDRAHRGNGCLQLLRGSHLLGRIEHGKFGDQAGADPKRTDLAMEHLELVYCEMEVGDALFFHANLLHRSGQNRSEEPRWGMICCYNTRHNPCEDRPGHPSYRPLEKWDDSRIREIGLRGSG